MLVANFNMSSAQMQVLLSFRHQKDTRTGGGHPMHDVDHTVVVLRKLCRDGYLLWHAGDREAKQIPGYSLLPKGEMMLRLIEDELRRTLAWFEGTEAPVSNINGAQHDVAAGKATETPTGRYRKLKTG